MDRRVLPASCLLVLAGASLLSSCAAGSGTTTAEVPAVTDSSRAEVAAPVAEPPPSATLLQLTAPNEVVSEAGRARRQSIVGDMLRLGTITAVQQGPVGVLRTAIGESFHTSNTRELQYPRLALAYSTWATPEAPLMIELWERGQKIGEFTEGAFFIGSNHTTPVDCAAPGPAGICGYGPGGAPGPGVAAPPAVHPGAVPAQTAAPSEDRATGHRGLHVNLGVGAGAADITCDGCDLESNTGLSGYVAIGTALAENLVLGAEASGWARSGSDSDAKVYSLMATLTQYLDDRSGLFLTAGAGLIGYSEDDAGSEITSSGLGYSGRLGYELRASGRLTFVPYVAFISTFGATVFERDGERFGEFNFNNLQAGLAVGIN